MHPLKRSRLQILHTKITVWIFVIPYFHVKSVEKKYAKGNLWLAIFCYRELRCGGVKVRADRFYSHVCRSGQAQDEIIRFHSV